MASQDLPVPELSRNMRLIGYTDQGVGPTVCGSWSIAGNLQAHDDLLVVINAKDMFAAAVTACTWPSFWLPTQPSPDRHAIPHPPAERI